jgi:hypothetical protein
LTGILLVGITQTEQPASQGKVSMVRHIGSSCQVSSWAWFYAHANDRTPTRRLRRAVWDEMRSIARQRYENGEMPEWFRPAWLDMEEAPMNTFWRAGGLKYYQQDSQWLGGVGDEEASSSGGGGSGDSGSGKGGGGGGGGSSWGRWWREEDPYWPLRNWGDHPMRWWTVGFGALLAAGGLAAFAAHGSAEAARVGLGCGATLAVCGGAMSDMQHGQFGELAVKAAWGEQQQLQAAVGHCRHRGLGMGPSSCRRRLRLLMCMFS